MKQDELALIANQWIDAWNARDLQTITSLMKEKSMFAQMSAMLEPIVQHGQAMIPELYIAERFKRDLANMAENSWTFSIVEIKTGENFVQIRYKLSNGWYMVDLLRFDQSGKIDMLYRNPDPYQWKWEVI